MNSSLNEVKLPIFLQSSLFLAVIFSICKFLRLKISSGKCIISVLLRSRVIKSLKLHIQDGIASIGFLASKSSFSFWKSFIASGKTLILFLEKSINLSFVKFLKF